MLHRCKTVPTLKLKVRFYLLRDLAALYIVTKSCQEC